MSSSPPVAHAPRPEATAQPHDSGHREPDTVGVLVPDIGIPFFASTVAALSRRLRSRGLRMQVVDHNDEPQREQEELQAFIRRGVRGVVVSSCLQNAPNVDIPLVFFDRRVAGAPAWVGTDNEQSTRTLITRLLEQDLLPLPTAYIGGPMELSSNRDRWVGWTAALRAKGHDPEAQPRMDGSFSPERGYTAMARLEREHPGVRSVFTAAYTILSGALAWLAEHPAAFPGLRIATFDDHPLLGLLSPRVSAAVQDSDGLARASLAALLDAGAPRRLEVPAVIRIRP
jgi:LacI family transcriptional regulator